MQEKIVTSGSQTTEYLTFLYNSEGPTGFVYNNTVYTYRKNIFEDIIAVYNGTSKVAEYAYDAYGNCTVLADVDGIATLNPFRYRSYYYDSETALYYLQSRYYDPELGRFINADDISYLDPETIHGLNLYAYCLNNPVMYVDPSGNFVSAIFGGLSALISGLILGQSAEQIAYNVAVAALTGFLVDVAVATGGAAVPIIIVAIGVINFAADIGTQMLFEDKKINEVDLGRAGIVGGIAAATSLIGFGIGSALPTKGTTVMSKMLNMLKDPASWAAGYVYSFGLGIAANIFVGSGAISTRGNSAQSPKAYAYFNCYSY